MLPVFKALCVNRVSMSKLFIFFTLIFSLSTNAANCVGHIFFYNFDESAGEADTNADFAFYYHKANKWLPNEGVSTSVHTDLPIKSKTCFSKEISIDPSSLKDSLGYVFMKPNMQHKVVAGVLTDIEICSMVNDFLKPAHSKRQRTAPAALGSQQVARLCGGS